jgi:hypothetical protein
MDYKLISNKLIPTEMENISQQIEGLQSIYQLHDKFGNNFTINNIDSKFTVHSDVEMFFVYDRLKK